MINVGAISLWLKSSQRWIRETKNWWIAIQEHPWYQEKKENVINSFKDKVKTLILWDELDLKALWNKKTEWLISDEEFKRMRLQEELNAIKKDPDFRIFMEIFPIIKAQYNKDKNNSDIANYINSSWINRDEKILFLWIYWKIISRIIRENNNVSLEPWMNNFELNILKENDAFFALWERDFNL